MIPDPWRPCTENGTDADDALATHVKIEIAVDTAFGRVIDGYCKTFAVPGLRRAGLKSALRKLHPELKTEQYTIRPKPEVATTVRFPHPRIYRPEQPVTALPTGFRGAGRKLDVATM
ncbi:MAG TPA: hypothetical protein VK601_16255, partial [Kofleriaceae bacterium]|nr:hypothetical protein [Kofleriaceae bacterium]